MGKPRSRTRTRPLEGETVHRALEWFWIVKLRAARIHGEPISADELKALNDAFRVGALAKPLDDLRAGERPETSEDDDGDSEPMFSENTPVPGIISSFVNGNCVTKGTG